MSSQRKGKSVASVPSSGVDPLAQDFSGMTFDSSQNGNWETVSKKNTSRAETNLVKQWAVNSSAPRAWGPDTANRLGINGNNGSGKGLVPGGSRHDLTASGQMGNPRPMACSQNAPPQIAHGQNWASRVGGSSQMKTVDDSPKETKVARVPVADEDDDDEDELAEDSDDDYAFSDGFDSDDSVKSFETRKKHRLLSKFFAEMDKLTMEEINDPSRQWHCPACQKGPGAIDWYKGLQPLATHAKTKGSKRIKLHREFAELLEEELSRKGTSYIPSGEYYGQWEGLRKETKDHEIIWPPMVVVMNTHLDKDDNDKWLGMGNKELLDYFGTYAALKAKHSYGPQGHRGMSVLIFETSAVGYMEAERLHNHFLSQGTGRDAWVQKRGKFLPGGRRQLHGFLATKDDLDSFNQHSQGKTRLKFDLRSYQEMVVSQMKQMSEDNQQLTRLKNKVAKEQRQSKMLQESLTMVTQKYRRASQQNRIVMQRSKMQYEENKAEMDFQAEFFSQQMKQIQDAMDAKEENFEKRQQELRKKFEMESTSDDCKKRTDVVADKIKLQDKEMEEFTVKRTEMMKSYEEKKAALKKRHMEIMEEELKLEKEIDSEISKLMEFYAPGSTNIDHKA